VSTKERSFLFTDQEDSLKRILIAMSAAAFGVLALAISNAFAQGGTGGGFPAQTGLFNDAVLLARVLPLVAALGIGFGIWQGKLSMRQPKSSPNSPFVIRHDFGTVVSHWINAIGFIGGIITGAIVLRWLQRPDEMRGVFAIHYVAASLMVFGVSSHLSQHTVTGGLGLLPRTLKDVREGLGELVEYAGIFGPAGAAFRVKLPEIIRETFAETFRSFGIAPPKKLGKYLPAEKSFSYVPWAIVVAVMVVTGLIKSFRYLYPIPPTFIASVTSVHDLFAYLSVAMLVIHLAAVSLAPRNWPLLGSMFTMRVNRQHVQQWHPLWFKELIAGEQPSASQPKAEQRAPAQATAE
jgi:cytochrome b subunit of formate dehydrogenase